MLSFEILLVAAVIGLYLADSAQLLYANEGLVFRARGRWCAALGSNSVTLLRRGLYVPAPFSPQRPIFRLTWAASERTARNPDPSCGDAQTGDAVAPLGDCQLPSRPDEAALDSPTTQAADESLPSDPARKAWDSLADRFLPLAFPLWLVGLGLFALLPLGLFSPLGYRAVLPALLLIYGGALWALVWVWRHRDQFGLAPPKWTSLAFESLICPPCALNLVRKLALRMDEAALPSSDLLHVAQFLLDPSDRHDLQRAILECLEERMDSETDTTGEQIRRLREQLLRDS